MGYAQPGLAMQEYLKEGTASWHRGPRGGWRAAGSRGSWTPWVVAGELSVDPTRLGPWLLANSLVCFCWVVFLALSQSVGWLNLGPHFSPMFASYRSDMHRLFSHD